ncbi:MULTISPECIES: hypothetical protein [Streptosporangium]|uniref:Secreted protein n=1 Tax=Streptosporangium brasiliense TaxID=47480 RepID=A0ABT9QYP4_9ACTN|nr:hypothetical protein [Streptosporangium brasiliense]MDP9862067.1 hypothetical protein [Streptosporangium brasiliense]
MIKTALKAGAAALTAAALLAAPALSAPVQAATVDATSQMPAGDDVYRDWYTSHSNCVTAGQGGIDRGHWDHYTCSEGDWLWHLWTNR